MSRIVTPRQTPLVYMAHPVKPEGDETIESNLASAKMLLKRLTEGHPDLCFIAPWITGVELFDDSNPELRAIGLAHCHAVITRCDRFWMVGPRVSGGMAGERDVAVSHGLIVGDFTGPGLP